MLIFTSYPRVSADPFINFPTNVSLSYKNELIFKVLFHTQILDTIARQDKSTPTDRHQ